jgi:hypothetical protein
MVGYRLWDSGWPKRVAIMGDTSGGAHIQVAPIPFTAVDGCVLVVVVTIHAALVYLVWRAWCFPFVRT